MDSIETLAIKISYFCGWDKFKRIFSGECGICKKPVIWSVDGWYDPIVSGVTGNPVYWHYDCWQCDCGCGNDIKPLK